MIDFALDTERKEGKSPLDAIYEACVLRFRPIMMTIMAALLGGLPLALATGTGAELRRPLGLTLLADSHRPVEIPHGSGLSSSGIGNISSLVFTCFGACFPKD